MSIRSSGVLILVAMVAMSCSKTDSGEVCRNACAQLESCEKKSEVPYTCPTTTLCTPLKACQARCFLDVSCDVAAGKNKQEADQLACCQQVCGATAAPPVGSSKAAPKYFPQTMDKDVDILFVIDNSNSMAEEQTNLAKNFPRLIEALRTPVLGNKIPNLHIGVTSTDLGAGNYSLPSCEVSGGDGGKLLATPRVAGCVPPSKPYIEYIDGVTNINNPAVIDPIEKVKEAFQCIAEIGSGGCGFESQIEAARRALDPKLNRNPGFMRKDAMLAVIFITDEDDCSAQKSQLFDPNQNQLNDPLGPLTSFRCFEFGVQCDCPGGTCKRTTVGARTNCKPAFNWLYKVEDYITFFKGLKQPGRVHLFAIAGPTDKVEVGLDGQNPTLRPSCQSATGKAVPGVRLEALVKGLGVRGHFNAGVDTTFSKAMPVDICSSDYSPALRLVGKVLTSALTLKCLSAPLTANGGVVCTKGESLGKDCKGQEVTCQTSCLEKADCTVTQVSSSGSGAGTIPRCEPSKFGNPADKSCGSTCPCWRLARSPDCSTAIEGLSLRLDVLRVGDAPKGTSLKVRCNDVRRDWPSLSLAELPQCK
jgi:hypothetical protein